MCRGRGQGLRAQKARLARVARDEPVDVDRLGLADAVAARLGLDVVLRVPVGVVDDHRVGGDEVDADAARARAKEEEELVGIVGEAVDGRLPRLARDGAVEPLVLVAVQAHVVLDEVEEHLELREDEDAVALLLQRGQQLVEQRHLARALDEPLEPRRVVRVLEALGLHDPFDEEGVVAAVA